MTSQGFSLTVIAPKKLAVSKLDGFVAVDMDISNSSPPYGKNYVV